METRPMWILILGCLNLHILPTTGLLSWSHNTNGLSQMILSSNGQHLFVSDNATLYQLKTANLSKSENALVLDSEITQVFDLQSQLMVVCTGDSSQCAIYNSSSLALKNSNSNIHIPDANATVLVTREKVYVACPHKVDENVNDLCEPGVTWKKWDTVSKIFQDPSLRYAPRSRFIKENPPIKTEKYIASFVLGDHLLFFSRQNRGDQNFTRVAQLCIKDKNHMMYTYVDMEVYCGESWDMRDVSKVMVGGVTIMVTAFYDHTGDKTDICTYSLLEIKERLIENFNVCYQGGYLRFEEFDYIKGAPIRCLNSLSYGADLCEGLDTRYSVIGIHSLQKEPVLSIAGHTNALTVVKKGPDIIAFLGTSRNGHIKKAVVYPTSEARQIPFNISLGYGKAVQKGMYMDQDDTTFYAFTNNKVFRIPVQQCGEVQECGACLGTSDPYCGWCILDNRCSVSEDCRADWIPASSENSTCVTITWAISRYLAVDQIKLLTLRLTQLPSSVDYRCKFHEATTGFTTTVNTTKDVVPNQLTVGSPNVHHLANQIRGTLLMEVSILTNVSNQPIATSHLIYYNCDTMTSCGMCMDPNYECRWCIYKDRCESTKRPSVCSENTEVQNPMTAVAGNCPNVTEVQILAASQDKAGMHYMSHDLSYTVQMIGRHFPQPRGDMHYSCKISSQDNVTFTAAYIDDLLVKCFFNKSQYELNDGKTHPTIGLYWGSHLVQGSQTEVCLYRCDYLTQSCDKCKSFAGYQPHYMCHWCSNVCQGIQIGITQQCDNMDCPAPTIQLVSPLSAAVNSSIILTIKGTNLGSSFSEFHQAVHVGELPCQPINSSYIPSESISCELDSSHKEMPADITVHLQGRELVVYETQFHFRIPEIHSLVPAIGPQSGGTRITITGRYLNTGNSQVIYIDESICNGTQSNENTLTCVTDKIEALPGQPLPLSVAYDNSTRIHGNNVTFQYLTDPTIISINPRQSFESGGRVLTVAGTNLHAVQKPAIFTTYPDGTKSTAKLCEAVSNTEIKCPCPKRSSQKRMKREVDDLPKFARIGFIMDGVQSVQHLDENLATLQYFKDPYLVEFTEPVKYHEILVIKGERLAVAADQNDVLVYIGDTQNEQKCNITSLKNDSIYCKPPAYSNVADDSKNNSFQILVEIGYFKLPVGVLDYGISSAPSATDETTMTIILSIVFGALIVCLIIFGSFMLWRINKKRSAASKEKYALEYRLDKLEATFRTQCREEFAALQTAVSDLTSDLDGGNVLFRDYTVYANKTLFASSRSQQMIMSMPNTLAASSQQALDNFKGLLRNQQFLLLLIRIMEKQKSFSIHDKSNVATILMVLNHDNLEFITDILKTLLNELVDKNIAANTPKLMLRRSESVSEKLLTHWLSICLYHFLKTETGSPLFFLYKAIKTQVEKGPVDYITGCGKYTLSEDKLLSSADTAVNAKTLVLEVGHFHYLDNEEKKISASVLDCDTVTQAKAKMLEILYKNIPFSQRPPVHKTLLEVEDKDGVKRSINDEDCSSIKDGLWKKINTLQHYDIVDGANARLTHSNEVSLGACSTVNASPDFYIIGSYRKSRPATKQNIGEDEVKISSDFFLPRLISTKGTLQTFIDDLFSAILQVGEEPPIIIKYIYDFLDTAATRHGITDPEVLHTWKCNSVILRFWVNILKNPEFVFDIHKPNIVDSCLSVVAQTLMDSCSTADLQLGPHSPSNKLLFAKDIPRYKQMVKTYFDDIQSKPAISDQDLNSFLTERVAQKFLGEEVDINSSFFEMYRYAKQYKTELMSEMDNLEASSPGSYFPISSKLEGVFAVLDMEQPQQDN